MAQFEKLIAQGHDILAQTKISGKDALARRYIPIELFQPWRTQCVNLLDIITNKNMIYHEQIEKFPTYNNDIRNAKEIWGTLQGIYEDFKVGFLDDLSIQIEGCIAVDYLQQANDLLNDKDNLDHSHIPAAVLAGVVLEKSIRTLCERQTSPLSVVKENGDFKKVMPLVEELVKIAVFTPPMARKVQSWLDIRNAAAHGRDNDFKPEDVKNMLQIGRASCRERV